MVHPEARQWVKREEVLKLLVVYLRLFESAKCVMHTLYTLQLYFSPFSCSFRFSLPRL